MTDKPYFDQQGPVIRLRIWVLGQMIWGAFLAGLFLIGIGAVLFVIYLLGELLPEESKQAPSPFGALAVETVVTTA